MSPAPPNEQDVPLSRLWPWDVIVPLQLAPWADELLATMVFLTFTVPVPLFLIPPPPPGAEEPAVLPVIVTLVRVTVAPVLFWMPPPGLVALVAVFPLIVTLVRVAVADDSL